MTRRRNKNLDVFIHCQYTRTILRKENVGQSLFKKYSKFQNSDEILYCGMTRLKNATLNYCDLCRLMKAIEPQKIVGQGLSNNHLKFQNFKFFIKTWPNAVTNKVFRKYIYTKTTERKKNYERKLWGKNILQNVLRVTVSVKYFNA